jgi:hypothetical protein
MDTLLDKLDRSHILCIRMRRRERTLLERLAATEERSLSSMVRRLIEKEAQRRLIGDDDDN